ncbi:GNAT family N-acetyltransferase [Polaribacter uvawellassae]|uniref:GNAT family N-acetyltransferase n=1 Tax=Polaribacter uvawellassae TaxID=3133495 RepID=UPI00321B809E
MIKLETFKEEDFSRLINWVDSEELMYIFSAERFKYPLTQKQLINYLKAKDRIVYKVINKSTNEIIGHADFSNINKLSRNARICSVLIGEKEHRNKGYGTKIIDELVNIGFNKMKLHRIDLGVYDFNKQAIKCYQKCGFEIEGLLKDNIKFNNLYWSTYNMSILNKEL